MNKTVTINLSGIVFHIDENAFELLKKYLERLKAHFSNTQGNEEIVADIESRMAEMFAEKNADLNKVIMAADVNAVIEAMGRPEDLPGNEEEGTRGGMNTDESVYYESTKKRFFRNPDDKVLGGVCSGISAYFDIDPIWLRVIFAFAIFFGGAGILIYLILWIIIPEARTTSEKLQMKAERVNVATIEKNVREEMESLRKKGEVFASKMTSDETRARVRTSTQKAGGFIGDILRAFGKFIVGIFGLIITLGSIAVLVGLTIAIFSGIGVFKFALPHAVTNMVLTDSQLYWLIAGGILAIGIPFTLLLLNGLKILFKVKLNLRMIGAVMAGLWLIGIVIFVITGMGIASEYKRSATVKETSSLIPMASDKIYIKALHGAYDEQESHDDFFQIGDLFILDEDADSVQNRMVRLDIEQSDNDSMYLVAIHTSRGKSYEHAKDLAAEINYSYSVTDSVIVLPNYFNLSTASKYRGQNVKLVLKLPTGKSITLDKSLGGMLDNVDNVSDTWDWDMLGHKWQMTSEGLECQNCPEEKKRKKFRRENTVNIDTNGIHIQSGTSSDY